MNQNLAGPLSFIAAQQTPTESSLLSKKWTGTLQKTTPSVPRCAEGEEVSAVVD